MFKRYAIHRLIPLDKNSGAKVSTFIIQQIVSPFRWESIDTSIQNKTFKRNNDKKKFKLFVTRVEMPL